MLATISPEISKEEIREYFHVHANLLFELQKGYLPPAVLKYLIEGFGIEDYVKGWESYLANLATRPHWRLAGGVGIEDFVSSMMSGHIPSKDTIQSQGGIWNGIDNYDPTRNGTRPTICPFCGSSFWSYEHGNTWKAFAHLGLLEFRSNRDDCSPPIRMRIEGKDKKVCSHIVSGPYESEQAALIACPEDNRIAQLANVWYVICGHPIDLMSFNNYVHHFIMKPLRAEHKRFLTAKTKGRMNTIQAYNCPTCGFLNEADEIEVVEEETESTSSFHECRKCGTRHEASYLTFFSKEKSDISINAPLGEDGKATIGDLLPSRAFVDEDLAQCEIEVRATLCEFTGILQGIVDNKVAQAERKYQERLRDIIPPLERRLSKAKTKKDKAKILKTQKELEAQRENLIKDMNKIDYSRNLVEMFRLHYIGDDEGNTYDLRRLTEMFMFKSLPYTLCRECGNKDFEQNETGKMQKQHLHARQALKKRAEHEDVPGYDRKELLNISSSELLLELGSYFHCTRCGSHNIVYFKPGDKNPEEPRVEITPHIFQPAQREIRELEEFIFSYKLICRCGTENSVRPDRTTGKLLDHKISKRIIEEDGERKALREKVEYRCSKCNAILTLEDVETSSKAKEAYSLLLKLKSLVEERRELRQAVQIQAQQSGESGWSSQLF